MRPIVYLTWCFLLNCGAIATPSSEAEQSVWLRSQERFAALLEGGSEDPQSNYETYAYGLYKSSTEAEQKITPEFLADLDVTSAEFIDAVRILLAIEPPSHLRQREHISAIGRTIVDEITRRGDAVTPILIELMNREKDNRYCGIQSRIFGVVGAVKTIDPLPFLAYARQYVIDHPNEKMTLENSSNYSGINQILSALGEEQDVPLLESREGGGGWLQYLKPRLAKEKETGTTRLEERRRESNEHKARYGLPLIQLSPDDDSKSSGKRTSNPDTKDVIPEDTGTFSILLALSLVLIGGGITIMTARRMR